jgi:hypothetical protein
LHFSLMEDEDSGMLIGTKRAACTAKAGPHYLMISLYAALMMVNRSSLVPFTASWL